MIFKDHTFV